MEGGTVGSSDRDVDPVVAAWVEATADLDEARDRRRRRLWTVLACAALPLGIVADALFVWGTTWPSGLFVMLAVLASLAGATAFRWHLAGREVERLERHVAALDPERMRALKEGRSPGS